eukprot:8455207-Lingulodinium_polyedra.AAC.1
MALRWLWLWHGVGVGVGMASAWHGVAWRAVALDGIGPDGAARRDNRWHRHWRWHCRVATLALALRGIAKHGTGNDIGTGIGIGNKWALDG